MQKTNNSPALRSSVKDVLGGEKVRASVIRVTSASYYSTRTRTGAQIARVNESKNNYRKEKKDGYIS